MADISVDGVPVVNVSVVGVPVVSVSVVDISVCKKLSVVAIVLDSTEDDSPADVELDMISGVDSETVSDDSDCDNAVDKEMAASEVVVDSVESDVDSVVDCTVVSVTSDVVVNVGNVVSEVNPDEGNSDVVSGESDVDAEAAVYSVDVVNSEVDMEASDDVVVDNEAGSSVVVMTGRDATTAMSLSTSFIKPLKPSYKAHSCQVLSKVTARHARFSAQNAMHSGKLRSRLLKSI
ncbi:hypothetical protein HG531_009409 [Fusarium graminearum]|nr:hypothetical protein HG531_009409 [Fusarium graminearum]